MLNRIGRNFSGTRSRAFAALISVGLLSGALMVSVIANPAVQSAGAAANAVIPTSASPGTSAGVINNYTPVSFPANDDGTYSCDGSDSEPAFCTGVDAGPVAVPLGFNVNFFGTGFNAAYVNNNGNITFSSPLAQFTPSDLTNFGSPIIAAYFADVDTRGSASSLVNFGTGTLNGQKVFVVNWPGVGCFSEISNVLNNFQLILIDRADRGTSTLGDDFDMEFNYNSIQWDTGTASTGDANCQNAATPGSSAYVGYSNGTPTPGESFNLPGSGVDNAFLDANSSTGLIFKDLNSTTLGRYLFTVNGGEPAQPTNLTTSLSGGGQTGASISVATNTPVTDTASLSGTNAATATGTVTYNVYSDSSCTTAVSSGAPETITTPGRLPASGAVSLPTVGTYYWQAVYSGNSIANGSTSTCGPAGEVETVTPARTLIGAGWDHTCARLTGGTVKCWGYNGYRQLGDGTTKNRHTPIVVAGLTGVKATAAGIGHTCALLTNGSVNCWGYNAYGQLGDGTTKNRHAPTVVPGLNGVEAITAGRDHTCALLTGGTVKCWGYNGYGQLGDGTTKNRHTPTAVAGLTNVAAIAAGEYHTCALLASGSVRCWGDNSYGRLGDGTTKNRHAPTAVAGLTNVAAIAAGRDHSCALLEGGTMKCWGYNAYGELGDGTTTNRHTPTAVASLNGVAEISLGGYHTCALLADGSVRCWGYNAFGQIGDGTTKNRHNPTVVTGLNGAGEISLGAYHSCALLTGGTVKCWGYNGYGQLGDGTTKNRHTPTMVVGL